MNVTTVQYLYILKVITCIFSWFLPIRHWCDSVQPSPRGDSHRAGPLLHSHFTPVEADTGKAPGDAFSQNSLGRSSDHNLLRRGWECGQSERPLLQASTCSPYISFIIYLAGHLRTRLNSSVKLLFYKIFILIMNYFFLNTRVFCCTCNIHLAESWYMRLLTSLDLPCYAAVLSVGVSIQLSIDLTFGF